MKNLPPSPAIPPLDASGNFSPEWTRFFARLGQAPPPFTTQVVGASPAGMVATQDGFMVVSGGTVSLIRLQRGNAFVTLPGTSGVYPVSVKDALVITYSVMPTVTFIPR